jgi:uncharacterized membrane protein YhaH (DUF805 family)
LGISSGGREMQPLVVVVALPAFVVLVWLALAMQVKRWHDLDNSGWMVLLNLTIIALPIVLIILGCVRGTAGPNKYGSDPLQTGLADPVLAPEVQAVPALEAQPQMSPISRIIGVLFSPKSTFEDIARKPSCVAPIVLLTLIGLSMNIFLAKKVDWRSFSEEQLMSSPRGQQIPADQKDLAIERGAKGNQIFCYVRGVIGTPFLALFLALIYWGAYALFGGARLTFGKSFAVIAFTMVPGGIRELLGIPILILKDPSTLGNPYNFVGSNPGAYMSMSDPKWLSALASSFDVFIIWSIILTAIGFHCMDPKKLPMPKSAGIVVGVYLFFTLLGTTVAWVFS